MSESPFWFVWNPVGRSPTVKHASEQIAVAEAERLARLNPGQTFIVLASVCARRMDMMQRIDMRAEYEPPF